MPDKIPSTLHIAVCDDGAADRQQISCLARDVLQANDIPCTVSAYSGSAELLDAIRGGADFSILLLDPVVDGMGGMELAAALRKHEDRTPIIFISSNYEMALRGYEVEALRYLAKPLERERLEEALLYCYQTRFADRELLLPGTKGQCRVPLSQIIYAEASARITKLFLPDGQEELNMKFSALEPLLPRRQFARCHRSYLVNLAYVKYLRSNELELKTGGKLPVSRGRVSGIRKHLLRYLEG